MVNIFFKLEPHGDVDDGFTKKAFKGGFDGHGFFLESGYEKINNVQYQYTNYFWLKLPIYNCCSDDS